jgi:hypothetical protein
MKCEIDKELQAVLIKCTAMASITIIVVYAVSLGHNGLFIGGGSAAIAGLAGYTVGKGV